MKEYKLKTIKEGFEWGGSLSAVQVDGIGETGRSQIWHDYQYELRPEAHWSGIGPNVCIDFTRRYSEDIETYKKMGINSIRYGFMWSRLFPDGKNLNEKAVKYYHDVIDEFEKAGIKLIMQLHHFDQPMWIKDLGGWSNPEVPKLFGKFAEFCFREYGKKIRRFSTFNEPAVMKGVFDSPDWWLDKKPSLERTYKECFGLMIANAYAFNAYEKIKSEGLLMSDSKLGVVINYNKSYPVNPENPTQDDLEAVKYQDAFQNKFWTDGMLVGKINKDVEHAFTSQGFELPITDEQRKFISNVRLDFMGENYYLPWRAEARPESEKQKNPTDPEFNMYKAGQMKNARMNKFRGWEIFPQGLKEGLIDIYNDYKVELYIGENGMGVDNEERFRGDDGTIDDEYRISYIKEHLIAMNEAMNEGVDVFGYHVWSITDLWSAFNSFKNRYGMVEINLNNNLERKLKKSANWYSHFIKDGIIKDDFEKCDDLTKRAMEESVAIQEKAVDIGKSNYDTIEN